ncbi:SEC-C metal-binding domain-containing protein [Pseudomonas sp. JQ36]
MYGLNLLVDELPSTHKATADMLIHISTRNYDDALKLAGEAQAKINEYKTSITEDSARNNCFIYYVFFELLKSLASYWKFVEAEKYYDSWCKLQDAFDCLRQLKRFYKDENIFLRFITRQLLSVEKVYPYKYFSSCGFVVEYFECSICSQNIDSDSCPHVKGQLYSGEMAIAIARNIKRIDHLAIVTNPKNKRLVLAQDDSRQEFNLLRLLILEFNAKKCGPLGFAKVHLNEKIRIDPDHQRAPRNSPCYCGSGKKYKKCCIKSEQMSHLHMDITLAALLENQASQL